MSRILKDQKPENAVNRMHDWANRADNPKLHKRAFGMEKRLERMKENATRGLRQRENFLSLSNQAFFRFRGSYSERNTKL